MIRFASGAARAGSEVGQGWDPAGLLSALLPAASRVLSRQKVPGCDDDTVHGRLMRVLWDTAWPRRGDGGDGQPLLTASGTPQPLSQGLQRGVPSDLLSETLGFQPSGPSAETAHVHEPAATAFVTESLDVVEGAHGRKRSAGPGHLSKPVVWPLDAGGTMLRTWPRKSEESPVSERPRGTQEIQHRSRALETEVRLSSCGPASE
jgi:hypothetical protein